MSMFSLLRSRCTLVLALAVVALVATAGGAAATSSAASAPFVINMPVAPSTLDPAEECGLTDMTVSNAVYARLTQYGSKPGPDGTTQFDAAHIVPYLAKSWTITHKGTVYTFHLHPGVTFSSGNPVNAAAVKFSLERAITMGGCGGYFIYDGVYTPPLVKSITTPNALTVVITLSKADANYLQDLAQPAASIVDPSVVDAHGGVQKGKINTWMAGHVAAGDGPFLLQSYSPDKQAVFVANPKFFAQPASKEVIVNFISSDPTLLLDARNGSADVTLGLSNQSAHSLVGNSGVNVVSYNEAIAEQLGLDNAKPPFNNAKVREAVSYAVPYQQILSKIVYGYGTLYYGAYPPTLPTFNAAAEPPRTYDLAKAQALIKASGIKTPVPVTLDVEAGVSVDAQIAQIVEGIWSQIGIDVTIDTLSPTAYTNALEGKPAVRPQAYIRLDGPGVIDAGYFLGYDIVCGISFNLSSICIPKADTLLNEARFSPNAALRAKLYAEINRLWIADSPKIPVYGYKAVVVLSKKVKHFFYCHEIDFASWAT